MSNKVTVKLKDRNCSHEPHFFTDSDNIHYIRNLTPNGNGDLKVDVGDIVIYTNHFQKNIDPKAKKNIALMMEGPEINRTYYDYISNNNNKFDLVLTFDKALLDRGENYKLNLYGTCWLHDSYIKIWSKSKLCSMITSNKTATSGHKIRHVISNYITQHNVPVDIYGGNYLQLPHANTKAYSHDHTPRHITNGKIYALKDHMFSITIENSKEDYMFTEKLIDCFLSGTVPIYYGCPSISKFFNEKGILTFSNPKECFDIIASLTKQKYDEMLPFIRENFEKAQNYTKFKINEEPIMELINE